MGRFAFTHSQLIMIAVLTISAGCVEQTAGVAETAAPAADETRIADPSRATKCFREAPASFAAKAEAELRATIVEPDRPACQGSVDDGLAICDVSVDAYVDEDGAANKVTTASIRGADGDAAYLQHTVECKLTCLGVACEMSGCLPSPTGCTPYDCGPGCLGWCTARAIIP
jgi:hypothetical protein